MRDVLKNACGLPVDAKVVQIDLSGPQVLVSEHFLRPVRVVKVRGHEAVTMSRFHGREVFSRKRNTVRALWQSRSI